MIGSPNSSRAVANACGKNPLPITVPCHRVIRSDGSPGGYSALGGIEKKVALLQDSIKKQIRMGAFDLPLLATSSFGGKQSNDLYEQVYVKYDSFYLSKSL